MTIVIRKTKIIIVIDFNIDEGTQHHKKDISNIFQVWSTIIS